jgi:hypothetical protein
MLQVPVLAFERGVLLRRGCCSLDQFILEWLGEVDPGQAPGRAPQAQGNLELLVSGFIGRKRDGDGTKTLCLRHDEGPPSLPKRGCVEAEREETAVAALGSRGLLQLSVIEEVDDGLRRDEFLQDWVEDGGSRLGGSLLTQPVEILRFQILAQDLAREGNPKSVEVHPLRDAVHVPRLDGFGHVVQRDEGRDHEDGPGQKEEKADPQSPTHCLSIALRYSQDGPTAGRRGRHDVC